MHRGFSPDMNWQSFFKTTLFGAIGLALTTSVAFAADRVELSFITDKGWVQCTVGSDWNVLSMKTKDIVRGAAFQVPNPPGEETSGPTNVLVMLFQLDSAQAATRYTNVRRERTKGAKSRIGAWEVFKSEFDERAPGFQGVWHIATLPTSMCASHLIGHTCEKTHRLMTLKWSKHLSQC